jgi:rare lipoprotein A (peptidoglycan hydrolase)
MNRPQTIGSATILGLLSLVFLPAPALAAQQTILPSPTFLNLPEFVGRDPYLAEAIDNLPSYSFQETGQAIASASPRTTPGNWPRPVKTIAKPYVPNLTTTPAMPVNLPADGSVLVLQGEASYYSRAGCLGCDPALRMANGQTLDDTMLTMAIGANLKHLVGHTARVTSLATGQSVNVRITDTGGFYQAKYGHRVADLTIATKNAIGMAGGVGQVRVEIF